MLTRADQCAFPVAGRRPPSRKSRAAGAVLLHISRLRAWLRPARRRRHMLRDMHGLSDHTLKDIGLSRTELAAAVRGRSCARVQSDAKR